MPADRDHRRCHHRERCPSRLHQDICRCLATALETACGTALAASTDVDLRLRDILLLNRRPDAVIYEAPLPDGAVLRARDS